VNESDRHYELHLTAEPRRLTVVRRIVAAHLRHWNLPDLVDLTVLGVTELLANVHRHVGPGADCVLRLTCSDGILRCAVHDAGSALPRLLHPDDEEISGRGLELVAALSKEWGAEAEETGKVVWFALTAVPEFTEEPPSESPAVPVVVAEPVTEPVRPVRLDWPPDYRSPVPGSVPEKVPETALSRS
jgi:hypothetical protein